MDFLDVCEEPSIQGNLVFSQKEKAIRENWQTAVAAYTGNNTQTQAKKKKKRGPKGDRHKKTEQGVCPCHALAWLLFTQKYRNVHNDAGNQQRLHESIIYHIYCLNTMHW